MNLDRVAAFRFPEVVQTYQARDSMLYALGLGYGSDPSRRTDLKFVFEQGREPLTAVPSFCVVLAHPGFWVGDPSLGIDTTKLVHGEQSFVIHRPLAAVGKVRGEYEIVAVEDKGLDKGSMLHLDKRLFDVETGEKLATVRSVYFLRGDGGSGSFGALPAALFPLPDGEWDASLSCTFGTSAQSALIYRLSGDANPVHADPEAAEKAGLGRPILQGLCTLGIAVRGAIDAVAGGAPSRIRATSARFSKPVYPGETLRIEFHGDRGGDEFRFRARAVERDAIVLDRGTLSLGASLTI